MTERIRYALGFAATSVAGVAACWASAIGIGLFAIRDRLGTDNSPWSMASFWLGWYALFGLPIALVASTVSLNIYSALWPTRPLLARDAVIAGALLGALLHGVLWGAIFGVAFGALSAIPGLIGGFTAGLVYWLTTPKQGIAPHAN